MIVEVIINSFERIEIIISQISSFQIKILINEDIIFNSPVKINHITFLYCLYNLIFHNKFYLSA